MDKYWDAKCREHEKIARTYDQTAEMENRTFHMAAIPVGGGYYLEVAEMDMTGVNPRIKSIVSKTGTRYLGSDTFWAPEAAMAWFKRVMFDHCQKDKEQRGWP